MLQKMVERAGSSEGQRPHSGVIIAIKTPDLSGFLTKRNEIFVKTCFHKNVAFLKRAKSQRLFDTLKCLSTDGAFLLFFKFVFRRIFLHSPICR